MAHEFKVQALAHCITGGTPLNTSIKVNPGDLLVITASPSDLWAAGEGDRTSNANGLGNPLSGNQYGLYQNGAYSFLYGSLVGTFDDGKTYFGIGTYLAMTILTTGVLKLVYWDGYHKDNTGDVKATVQVYTGPKP
jgi:hypothetical protein